MPKQTQTDNAEPQGVFPARMLRYHNRLRDRYQVPVVSLAVLADTRPDYRPDHFRSEVLGCELTLRFPVAKLLDWQERWAELEASENVFAVVVMAQVLAKRERDDHQRKAWKLHLAKLMYERGYSREDILELMRIVDWMIRLPELLEREFREELYAYEEEKRMPYVTTFERAGVEKGETKLLLWLVEKKFGAETADRYRAQVEGAGEEAIKEWSARILYAEAPEEVFT